jgi:hypothetical protein
MRARQQNAAGVPRKTLINALETEKNPQTGQPFFPTAITSRMATGWPLLFNHLQAHHLDKISGGAFPLLSLFEKQDGIEAGFDELVPTALLFQEGGARTRARCAPRPNCSSKRGVQGVPALGGG